jgi:hypothetical protein
MKTTFLIALTCLAFSISTGQSTYRKAIFLHHSVGDVIYHGSYEPTPVPTTVPLEIAKYNTAHGYSGANAVLMDEPSTRLFPAPNTSENDWWYWQQIFSGSDAESSTFNSFLSTYSVIIVKTCYLSEEFMTSADSVETYKTHYRAVVKYMSQHSNFFVIWNNYPAYYTGTQNQLRSLAFSKWAKDTMATGKDVLFGTFPGNVYVFDVFRKVADPNTGAEPLQYIIGNGDEHPSNAAVAIVTPPFVKEVFDAAIAYESGAMPVVNTLAASNITSSGAQLNGSVNPGGLATTSHFEYGTTTSYGTSTSNQSTGSGTATVAVNATLSSLSAGTTYHCRLVATYSGGTVNGSDVAFTTTGGTVTPPSVSTSAATGITSTGAQLNGSVNPNAAATVCHFEYGATTSYGTSTSNQSAGSGTVTAAVNATLSSLSAGTTYHCRLAATYSGGTVYGSDVAFTTTGGAVTPPSVSTSAATSITSTGAQLNGSVNPNAAATVCHFEYGISTSYGSSTSNQSAGSGTVTVAINATLSNQSAGTTFHYRLAATYSGGTVYGSDAVFTTGSVPVPPSASTSGASTITPTAAQLNGSVNPNGYATSYHFEYGTTTGYGTLTSTQSAGSGLSAAPVNAGASGFSPATLYHYRLVASSSGGTTNGRDTTFTTSGTSTQAPTVRTLAAGNVTATAMQLSGSVNPNGSATSYSFEYGTTTSYGTPTISQSAGFGSSETAVSAAVSGLTSGTHYHYRLVATNSGGTSYGSDSTATTAASEMAPPAVITSPAGGVTTTGAQLNGIVNPNGVITSFYFEYGLTQSFGSSTPGQSVGSSTLSVPVSANVANLTPGAVYHYRLVATNVGGTTYGIDTTFATVLRLPREAVLLQNYPNPFNPTTTIRYSVPRKTTVTLTVFNALGQPIVTLVNSEQEAGFHQTIFDGSNLASGVYFYRLEAGDYMEARRIMLVH